MSVSVTVWNEYRSHRGATDWMSQSQQAQAEAAAKVYPDGIHAVIAEFLSDAGFEIRTATLDAPSHGLSDEVLDETDVLVWWSHYLYDEVSDEVVENVFQHVQDGMGLIILHSARKSKIFRKLMGTTCAVQENRSADEIERLWILDTAHPIVDGLDEQSIEIPKSQIMAEPFEIPEPAQTIFMSWIEGGEVFRSGCCFQRGKGKIFFFGPGHETHPVYYQPEIQTILTNAVKWTKPVNGPSDSPSM